MADRILRLDRRELLAGLGAAVLGPAMASIANAQGHPSLTLRAKAGVIALRPGAPDTPIWSLQGPTPAPSFRFKRGDELNVTLQNELPVPTVLNWRGIDGVPSTEPLAARMPLGPGAKETFVVPLRYAGTFLCDLRLLGDGQAVGRAGIGGAGERRHCCRSR
jgi:FtsP/CotA-like multicopper oxidase with cupredoxin domain